MPPLSFTILNRTRCSRVIGSQTCSERPSQPYITIPPNLTSVAVTPRSVAPPLSAAAAGSALAAPGVGGAGTGAEADGAAEPDVAGAGAALPEAVGLAPADTDALGAELGA